MTTFEQFARQETARRMKRLSEEVAAAAREAHADAVHDVRVAIRRLSQALRVFGPVMDEKRAKKLRKSLKPLMEAAAEVRDCDIAMQLLSEAHLPANHTAWDELRAERAAAEIRFGQEIEHLAPRAAAGWPDVLKRRGTAANEPAHLMARARLPLLLPEFFESGGRMARTGVKQKKLHDFRLETKRLRYTLELFRPLYGPGLKERIELLKAVQDVLGEAQDYAVTKERLERRARQEPGLAPFVESLQGRLTRKQAEFRRLWRQEVDTAGALARWSNYLKRRSTPPANRPQ